MKKPKVLHVVLKGDGLTEIVAEDINAGMIKGGCEVTMVYLRDKKESLPKTDAQHTIGLGLTLKNRLVFDWLASRKLSRILKSGTYDVVVSHRYKPCMLLLKLVKKFPRIEFVNVVHGTGHYDKPARKRAIVRHAHERFRFVCVSDAVAEFIRTTCGVGETSSQVEVIPNGIDIQSLDDQQVSRNTAREKLGLEAESLWIGFAGRLVKIKGVVELIEGFSMIAEEFPNAKLAILGKGDLREELQVLIRARNLQGRVLLVGQVPQARKYFKAFDGFILPSYREGMSIALLEAMATGLPLLVSDIPMNTDLVERDAIVFEMKNPAAVAGALASFLNSSEKERAAKGARNRKLAEEKYSLHLFRNRYADLARRLASKEEV